MDDLKLNPDQYRLSEQEHEEIFQKKIKTLLFDNVSSVKKPVAAIFGGQPGAGKVRLLILSQANYSKMADVL